MVEWGRIRAAITMSRLGEIEVSQSIMQNK